MYGLGFRVQGSAPGSLHAPLLPFLTPQRSPAAVACARPNGAGSWSHLGAPVEPVEAPHVHMRAGASWSPSSHVNMGGHQLAGTSPVASAVGCSMLAFQAAVGNTPVLGTPEAARPNLLSTQLLPMPTRWALAPCRASAEHEASPTHAHVAHVHSRRATHLKRHIRFAALGQRHAVVALEHAAAGVDLRPLTLSALSAATPHRRFQGMAGVHLSSVTLAAALHCTGSVHVPNCQRPMLIHCSRSSCLVAGNSRTAPPAGCSRR